MSYGEANANFGTNYTLEKSTYNDAAWLFIRNSPTGAVKGVLNLSVEDAIGLRHVLNTFINDQIRGN